MTKKKFLKKYSYSTDLRQRKTLSLLKDRLKNEKFGSSEREMIALNFLLKKRGRGRLLWDMYGVLSMTNDIFVPKVFTPLEKLWGEKFRENKEIVDALLQTLFQWFGTNVGFSTLEELLSILKAWNEQLADKQRRDIRKKIDSRHQ